MKCQLSAIFYRWNVSPFSELARAHRTVAELKLAHTYTQLNAVAAQAQMNEGRKK